MSARNPSFLVAAVVTATATTAVAETATPVRGDQSADYPIWASNANANTSSAIVSIFTRGELLALPPDVVITGLEFDKADDATTGPGAGALEIYLVNTTETTATFGTLGSHKTGATRVYSSAAQRVPATQGWWSPGAFNGAAFTYTGQGLKVIVVWNGSTLPAMKSYNRSKLAFGAVAAGLRTAAGASPSPFTDGDSLNNGPARPNIRLTYTPPSAPYLVMSVGDSTIAAGATYTNASAFTRNVATPQNVVLKNAGGAAADLSAGFTFTNQTNVTNATVAAAPASLAAGATANAAWSHTPIAGGTASYTVAIGGFSFTQQGTASTSPQVNAFALHRDVDGRSHDRGFSGTSRDVLVNVPESFVVRVVNAGTAPITSVELPTDMVSNMTTSCDVAGVTVPVAEHVDIPCMATVPALGVGSTRFTLTVNGTVMGFLYFSRTAVTPAAPPPAGTPQLALSYQASGVTAPVVLADGATVTRPATDQETILLTIGNTGTAPLVVSGLDSECFGEDCELAPDDDAIFPLTIQPGTSHTVSTTMFAQFVNSFDLVVHLRSNDPDPGEDSWDVTFAYAEAGPDIDASYEAPTSFEIDQKETVTVTVFNRGMSPLTLTSFEIVQKENCDVTIDGGSPGVLGPGESTQIVLGVVARDFATFRLAIASDDPDEAVLNVDIERPATSGGKPADGGCVLSASDGGTRASGILLAAIAAIAVRPRRRRSTAGRL